MLLALMRKSDAPIDHMHFCVNTVSFLANYYNSDIPWTCSQSNKAKCYPVHSHWYLLYMSYIIGIYKHCYSHLLYIRANRYYHHDTMFSTPTKCAHNPCFVAYFCHLVAVDLNHFFQGHFPGTGKLWLGSIIVTLFPPHYQLKISLK